MIFFYFYKRTNDYRNIMLITEMFSRDKREITKPPYNTILLNSNVPEYLTLPQR